MSRRVLTAAFAALLGALCSPVLLAVFYMLRPALRIDFAVDPPRLMTGIYPAERDVTTGLTFAWTAGDVALRLPGLDRRVPWTATARLRGGRTNDAENPAVLFFVDGARMLSARSGRDFADLRFDIPARPERSRGALVTMQVSSTFTPGPADPRPLGVMLDRVTLAPQGIAIIPQDALAASAVAGAALAGAVALTGVTPGSAIGAALLIGGGQATMAARGFAPYTAFPELASRLGIGIGISLVGIVLTIERVRGAALRNTARFAVAFSAAAMFLKLLVLLHPDMPIGDALFQAHRFQEVLRGNFYFTSIAPGNYAFPYPPGLYVAALPFADLVRREAGDVMLLRIVVVATDAVVGALLYTVVVRGWGDRRAAAFAAAIYQLLPLGFMTAAGGTLTSAFAQSVAVLSLGVMAARWLDLRRAWTLAILVAVLLAAFLSHTSTFAILSVTVLLVPLAYIARGAKELRSAAWGILAGGAAAILLAIAVYYAHFLDTYRTELARIGGETAAAAADAGGRSIGDRLRLVPWYLRMYIGIPALILTAGGAWDLYRRARRDRLTLTTLGWALACATFLVIGIVTPVDMRYYLAALPAIAIAAAAGASAAWEAGGRWRSAAVLLLGWILWLGLETWWRTAG